jgi:hypothetical protein
MKRKFKKKNNFIKDLSDDLFRKSEQVLLNVDDHLCRVSVPRTENTIHYIQFRRALTSERRFFFVELENISKYFSFFNRFFQFILFR